MADQMVMNVRRTPPDGQRWCDRCNTTAAYIVDRLIITPDGIDTTKSARYCTTCDGDRW